MGSIQTSKSKTKKLKEESTMKNIEQEVKQAIESLEGGQKIQLELDKKNKCLKIWKLKLNKIEVKDGTK